jgi:hypothetical protein
MNTVSENHQFLPAALGSGQISHPATYSHPHPDPAHVMRCYRGYLVKAKRQRGGCRSLFHYRAILQTYLSAKRAVFLGEDHEVNGSSVNKNAPEVVL